MFGFSYYRDGKRLFYESLAGRMPEVAI